MTPTDPFDLQRFVDAQNPVFGTVLEELREGRKRSHWMWFVFPQLRGLGRSATAGFYGIVSVDEARAYLAHPILGARLEQATRIVLATDRPSLRDILGSPDDRKFCSCMTLFSLTGEGTGAPYREALRRWCDGRKDDATLLLLKET